MRRELLATAAFTVIAACGAAPAFAQTAETEADAAAATDAPGQQIIVTGSRSTTRTVENSPVPVDVLSGDMLTEGGQTETNRILNKLVPSFNFPQPAISDGSDALRPASLRGLAPDQTLVLINGKRRHTAALLNINGTVGRGSAAVDMNAIPALAIERIEVLRDGASSQYGSDAIAGVINIRLKTANDRGKAVASYGKYVTTLDGVDRVTGLQTNAAGQPILDPADNRYFLNITAEYRHRDRTNRTGFDLRPNYIQPTGTTFDTRELAFNRREFRFGDPIADDYTFFVNSGVQLSDVWEGYVYGSFNQRDSTSAANYRQQSNAANVDYSVLAPNQTRPTVNTPVITPDGFLPLIATDYTDYSYTAGLRGEIMGWRADFSAGVGSNHFDYEVQNSVNATYGAATQRSFDAGGLRYRQGLFNADFGHDYEVGFAKPLTISFGGEYRRETYTVRSGEFASYGAGPFFRVPINGTTLANCTAQQGVFNAGSSQCTFPGRSNAVGAQGFPGLPASAGSKNGRHNVAAYLELDTDPFAGLSMTAAGRYEHYSDFGDSFTGKLAGRYEFIPGLAVRGSVSNGFRAPSVHQQFFSGFATNFLSGIPVDIYTLPVANPVSRALGSKDLKAEKSFNLSAGVTASPLSGLTLTVDYYNIKIKDRVVLTENLGATNSTADVAIRNYLFAQGLPVTAVRFFVNGLDTRTQGIDAVMNYRMPVAGGRINLTAAYNYNNQKILARNNTLGPFATVPGIILFGRLESLRFTDGQPKDKVVLSMDGDFKPFGFTLRTTRFGKVIAPGSAAPLAPNQASFTALGPDDVVLSPKWITDVELRFDVTQSMHLAVGADNVLDVYPDRLPFGARPTAIGGTYPQNQQYNGYSNFSPFGFNGRYIYGRIGVDF
jgi:iron complex outermembrane receptor protein